ncbi:MAG: TDT family transporter [Lachnospiraceae bacterium]|nr:TDT family transporter [Lachnospiraceae bacterium]
MNFIKKIPLPFAGVFLGLGALGNLLQVPLLLGTTTDGVNPTGNMLRSICGVIAWVCLILYIIKLLTCMDQFKEEMKNPIMASASAPFPMAIMLLSTYVKPLIGGGAKILWFIGLILDIVWIVYFILTFVVKGFDIKKVFGSWYVLFCGIAVAGVTAPAFEQQKIGAATVWIALLFLIVLLFLVFYRYSKFPNVPDPAKPLFCICTAPMSLVIAGYIQSVEKKNLTLLLIMWAVAAVLFVISLYKAITYLKLPFFPSYAAWTFPFVITAIASKQLMACAMKMEHPLPFLRPIVIIQTVIAAAFVIYVFVRYLAFLFAAPKKG